MSSLWAFALFAGVLALTPGLDTMLVLRTAVLGGRRAGLAAVAGVGLGCAVWALAGALGVTAVLAASRFAFDVLRYAGVAYLCWLGIRALLRAAPPASSSVAARPAAGLSSVAARPAAGLSSVEGGGRSAGRALRTGFTTNLLNPKVGVFYLSVLPQFLPAGLPPLAGSLLLGAIHIGEGAVWLSLVVLVANRARGWLTRPAVGRRLEQLTGAVFLGFGLRLALERPPG